MKQIPSRFYVVRKGFVFGQNDYPQPYGLHAEGYLAVFGGKHHGHTLTVYSSMPESFYIDYGLACSCGKTGSFNYDTRWGQKVSFHGSHQLINDFLPRRIMTVESLIFYSGPMAMIKVGDTFIENKKEYKWFRNKWFILGGAHSFHLLTHEHYRLEDGCITSLFNCSCGVVCTHADSLNCDRHRSTGGNELKAYYFIDVLNHAKRIEGPDVNS